MERKTHIATTSFLMPPPLAYGLAGQFHLSLVFTEGKIAADPSARSLTFCGFSGKHLDFPKSESLKIRPNSSQEGTLN